MGEELTERWVVRPYQIMWAEYVEVEVPVGTRFLSVQMNGMYRQLLLMALWPLHAMPMEPRAIARVVTNAVIKDDVIGYIGTVQSDRNGYSGHFFEVQVRDRLSP